MKVEHRLLSQPMRVLWAGWETDTLRLQRSGWQLSAEQDVERAALRMMIHHPHAKLYGLSDTIRLDYHRYNNPMLGYAAPPPLPITMRYMASNMTIRLVDNFAGFAPIDAMPQMVAYNEEKSIEDFKIFAAPTPKAQEIIVDPQDVDFFLRKILELQRPVQAEIRKRNPIEDERPRQIHAQILSFAA